MNDTLKRVKWLIYWVLIGMCDLLAQIHEAAHRLANGQLVAFPTETVYGLGADASNPQAVKAIFTAKGRPDNHPVIVHVAPGADLSQWVASVSPEAQQLMAAFWPGPLTLILPRSPYASALISGGQDTIGIRCPSHPVAQALLKTFADIKGADAGVAAPSANRFGHVSPTRAQHVRDEFPNADPTDLYILAGGDADVGIESTIVDLSNIDKGEGPVILRPGHISADQIAAVLQCPVQGFTVDRSNAPRVSGSLKAHYAPKTPLYLRSIAQMDQILTKNAVLVHIDPLINPYGLPCFQAPNQASQYASQLYAVLRDLDTQGFAAIYVQQPPQTADWEAVNDRLQRAAAAFES